MPAKRGLLTRSVLIPLTYLLAWELASLLVGNGLLLPGPLETVARFVRLLALPESWIKAGLTLLRVLAGYAAGVVSGVLLAALCAKSPFADALLTPLRGVVKATPVTSIILLAILWLVSGLVPVFISFLMVLPIVWSAVLNAIRETDKKLLEMARAFRFPFRKTVRLVYAPSVQPAFLAAATTGLGFAWKSGVAAEILSLPKRSVGYMLYESKLTLETADLFAWTLLVVLLSMLIEWLLSRAMRRIRG